MNKKELASRVAELLRINDVRKPVKIKKHTFRIIDEEGNTANFSVKRADKKILYTNDDVNNIIDACIAIILDAIKNGEEINIRGFGVLGLHYRAARRTKQPGTEDWYEVDARYVPKFFYGNDLRMAAQLYDISRKEKESAGYNDSFDEEFDDLDGDGDDL